jgi:hypothetical protein
LTFIVVSKTLEIMAVELMINGYFEMTFHNVHTEEEIVEKDIEQGILDNLQQGEYFMGLDSKNVYDINDLNTPIYKFSLDGTDAIEYDFNELEEE